MCAPIPHICNFSSTYAICGQVFPHTKRILQQNSLNCTYVDTISTQQCINRHKPNFAKNSKNCSTFVALVPVSGRKVQITTLMLGGGLLAYLAAWHKRGREIRVQIWAKTYSWCTRQDITTQLVTQWCIKDQMSRSSRYFDKIPIRHTVRMSAQVCPKASLKSWRFIGWKNIY